MLKRKYDEADETFMREITPAEEDLHLFTSAPWRGGYRWYRSPNVVCLALLWQIFERQGFPNQFFCDS
jgi:hypothetical protein